ncbi:hypothetical protein M5K25_012083 [Dendrobium thyrsiflorum]|uniref:Uncharacterized protein n=1 Tax=Dendrobium thyrsiflorum TaxID=117978 RepID=A0ABD0UW07_DENTH
MWVVDSLKNGPIERDVEQTLPVVPCKGLPWTQVAESPSDLTPAVLAPAVAQDSTGSPVRCLPAGPLPPVRSRPRSVPCSRALTHSRALPPVLPTLALGRSLAWAGTVSHAACAPLACCTLALAIFVSGQINPVQTIRTFIIDDGAKHWICVHETCFPAVIVKKVKF